MKTILFWVLILATAVLLYQVVQHTSSGREQVYPFSKFLEEAAEEVRSWPTWKQAILGLPQSSAKGANAKNTGDASREQQ